jgi:hypothetical protein
VTCPSWWRIAPRRVIGSVAARPERNGCQGCEAEAGGGGGGGEFGCGGVGGDEAHKDGVGIVQGAKLALFLYSLFLPVSSKLCFSGSVEEQKLKHGVSRITPNSSPSRDCTVIGA